MTTFRDALADAIASSQGCDVVQDADAVLAMPEMRNVLAILQDHKRYNPDYWHPNELRIHPAVRAWVERQ